MSFHHLVNVKPVEAHCGPVVCSLSEWFRIPESATGFRPSRVAKRKAPPKRGRLRGRVKF